MRVALSYRCDMASGQSAKRPGGRTAAVSNAIRAAVEELVAEKGEWGRKVPKGHGLGIAVHRSFVSYIATIVEVAIDDKGKLMVPRVDTAIDCGFYANPERIRSQIEGAAVMGLSLAMVAVVLFPVLRQVDEVLATGYLIIRGGSRQPPTSSSPSHS